MDPIEFDLKSAVADFTSDEVEEMKDAGAIILECTRVLSQTKHNVVNEILRFSEEYLEWSHIPPGDVHDKHSQAQYYYHTHSKAEDLSGPHDDEHGHFHTFIRAKGMPEHIKPVPLGDLDPEKDISDVLAHIVGIAMDKMGAPIKLFTTNRWVTAETWFKASDVIELIDQFEIDHAQPSWPANLWVSNMVKLFRPQIISLIEQRDMIIEEWGEKYPEENIFEDRKLEVTSWLPINLENQIDLVNAL